MNENKSTLTYHSSWVKFFVCFFGRSLFEINWPLGHSQSINLPSPLHRGQNYHLLCHLDMKYAWALGTLFPIKCEFNFGKQVWIFLNISKLRHLDKHPARIRNIVYQNLLAYWFFFCKFVRKLEWDQNLQKEHSVRENVGR